MQIVIKAKNADVTEQLRQLIEDKTGKLDRYLDNITTATVEVNKEKTRNTSDSYAVQMTLSVNGHLLRAEERAADARSALDSVLGVMQRQITRYKGKHYQRGRSHAAKEASMRAMMNGSAQPVAVPDQTEEEADEPRIVRTKQFTVKPMTPEEAAEQMELLSHDFFIFRNAGSQHFNVLYKRKDGNYGLIEPEQS